jgi:hypothetical protein
LTGEVGCRLPKTGSPVAIASTLAILYPASILGSAVWTKNRQERSMRLRWSQLSAAATPGIPGLCPTSRIGTPAKASS